MNIRTRSFLAVAAALILSALEANADGGVPLWTNLYFGPHDGDNFVSSIAVDQSGDVFVTGSSTILGSATNPAVTVAYSGSGVPLWTNRYFGGGYYTGGRGLAIDTNGNVFMAGFAAIDYSAGDYATVAYSHTGAHLWVRRYNGPATGNDSPTAIALDNSGNVFVTGVSVHGFASADYATLAYSSTGVPLWTNRFRGSDDIYSSSLPLAIATDTSGNVFVTGGSDGVYGTVAYSGAGVPLWTNRFSESAFVSSQANAMALDQNGNVFVTGYTADAYGNFEYATVAYSGAGVPLWTNIYQGPGYDDYARAIAVDQNGNVFVAGDSAHSYVANATYDYVVVAYSNSGMPLWTNRGDGPGTDWDAGVAVATDHGGNVIITGHSADAQSGFLTVAYSGLGVPLWTNHYSRPDNPYPFRDSRAGAIALDRSGNVFVAGHSRGTNHYYSYATIKYSSSMLSVTIQISPLASFPGSQEFIVIATNNTSACMTLKGTSTDANQDSLTYQWFHDADLLPFASGNPVTDCLDVGIHTVRLALNDGYGSAGSAAVAIQVISPCSAVGLAMATVENSSLPDNRKHAFLVSLQAACASFDGGQITAGINQLNAFENKVRAQVQDSDPALAETLIQAVQTITAALGGQ